MQQGMKTSDYRYDLPEELIAQTPILRRDQACLMVLPKTGPVQHRVFTDIESYLSAGDVLVVNETAVLPARLLGLRETTGAHIEVLLLKQLENDRWETLVRPGRRVKEGEWLSFGNGKLRAFVESRTEAGGRIVRFAYEGVFLEVLDELGQMPLPPYIHEKLEDKSRYQTVYAKTIGSAAAPTAGLHFTPELLKRLEEKGVVVQKVLLHVGLGTFRPVSVENVQEHTMHSEYYEITQPVVDALGKAKAAGHKVFAVGTTSVRVLETASVSGTLTAQSGWTDIFIYPGFTFHTVDSIITNFHLPESTLMMLVSAFAGRERIMEAYRIAVEQRYRFFSFGDAMLLL